MPQEVSFTADGIEEAKVLLDGFEYGRDQIEGVDVTFRLDVSVRDGPTKATPPDDPEPLTPDTRFHFALSALWWLSAKYEEKALSTNEVWEEMNDVAEEEIPRPSGALSRLYGEFGMIDRTNPPDIQGYRYYLNERGEDFLQENGTYPE